MGYLRLRALIMTLNDSELSFIQDIHEVPGYTYQDKLNHLHNCSCCERHKINRPRLFIPWRETEYSNNPPFYFNCNCKCRHLARFICRQAPGYNPLQITRMNTPTSVLDFDF